MTYYKRSPTALQALRTNPLHQWLHQLIIVLSVLLLSCRPVLSSVDLARSPTEPFSNINANGSNETASASSVVRGAEAVHGMNRSTDWFPKALGIRAGSFQLPLTIPVEAEFNTDEIRSPKDVHSWSHCFGNSGQFDGWRTSSCLIRNLCFNLTSKSFIFYAASPQHAPENVSIATFNYKWGRQYDNTVRFVPQIVNSSIPSHAIYSASSRNELWMPFLPFCPANIGHLIWDDYLPLYLMTWNAQPFLPGETMMRPLWYNPPHDPPWATCDWIRLHEGPGHSLPAGYSTRCTNNNQRWASLLLGPDHVVIPETSRFQPRWADSSSPKNSTSTSALSSSAEDVKQNTSNTHKSDLICFDNAGYGLTTFANQASGHHGWNPTDSIPPSFGRAPLLFAFTRHMMHRSDVRDASPKSLRDIVIFFSSQSSNRVIVDFGPHVRWINQVKYILQKRVNALVGHDRLRIVIKHEVLAKMNPRDQIRLASRTCVFVTAAGGGAFTAQFLPRGSTILLFHAATGEHLHKGRVDWKVFNAASWMRARYFEMSDVFDQTLVTTSVSEGVMNCVAFMEALDAS